MKRKPVKENDALSVPDPGQVDLETANIRDQAIQEHRIRYRNAKGKQPPPTNSVVLYARFSPRPNASTCESINWQLDLLRKHAEKQGWKIVGEFRDEAESGADINRVGLWQAVSKAREPGCAILVHRLDRLARDRWLFITVEHELAKAGARIISASGEGNGNSPEDDMIRGIVVLIADFHRRMNNARCSAAARYRVMTGGPSSSHYNLLGMMDDTDGPKKRDKRDPERWHWARRKPCPNDWAIIAKIFELWDRGLRRAAIMKALNKRGMLLGGTRRPETIYLHRTIKNRHLYVGLSIHFAEYLKQYGLQPIKPVAESLNK